MIRDGLMRIAPLAKALAMCAVVGAAVLPQGCTIKNDDGDDDGGQGGEGGERDGRGGSSGWRAGGPAAQAKAAGQGLGYCGEAAGAGARRSRRGRQRRRRSRNRTPMQRVRRRAGELHHQWRGIVRWRLVS